MTKFPLFIKTAQNIKHPQIPPIMPLATYEEIYTHLLPESDVLALQQGLYLANEAELQQRLEDYGL